MSILGDRAEGEMLDHENKMMAKVREERKLAEEARSRDTKQVIVIRTDLKNKNGEKVRTGKLIAQGAHASLGAIHGLMGMNAEGLVLRMDDMQKHGIDKWMSGMHTKVCCKVASQEDLLAVYDSALAAGLPCSLVRDAGLTEFSEPTYTCVAVGPSWSDDVDKVTGHLNLL